MELRFYTMYELRLKTLLFNSTKNRGVITFHRQPPLNFQLPSTTQLNLVVLNKSWHSRTRTLAARMSFRFFVFFW